MPNDFMMANPGLLWLGEATQFEEDLYEIIGAINLFENFSFDEVRALCRFMHCYAAPRDFELLTEGDQGDYLMLVLTGQVNVLKKTKDGSEQLIASIEVGGTLGEMSLIDGLTRIASCVTTMPTDVAVLTRESFNNVLLQMPRLGNKLLITLLQTSTGRLRETIENYVPSYSQSVYGAST